VELQSARPRSPATSEPGNDRFAGSRRDVIAAVERGLDALAPMLAHLLTDRSISGESAMIAAAPAAQLPARPCAAGKNRSFQPFGSCFKSPSECIVVAQTIIFCGASE
jgi:hypothetical protein